MPTPTIPELTIKAAEAYADSWFHVPYEALWPEGKEKRDDLVNAWLNGHMSGSGETMDHSRQRHYQESFNEGRQSALSDLRSLPEPGLKQAKDELHEMLSTLYYKYSTPNEIRDQILNLLNKHK